MAVVQISKIQVRRGQKLQGSGLPQLASGELGWAIDTRELFIGNGSVAEGAPAVGNTKVLTEYDDLFSLADTYTYKSSDPYIVTGPNSSNAVKRTLQSRLDDIVSIRAFGAKGDGVTDDTVAIQRAIDQLFLNDATKGSTSSMVTLNFLPGTYVISDTLYIPPFASITGAGSGKTIIKQTANKPAMITVNGSSTPGNPETDASSTTLNQPRNIQLRHFTIETTGSGAAGANNINSAVGTPDTAHALILESCKDSTFEDIHFLGTWINGTPDAQDNGVVINCLSGAVESKNNTFTNCRFEGFGNALRSKWDTNNNIWDLCNFERLGHGFVFGYSLVKGSPSTGQSTGPTHNTISNSTFTSVYQHAIWIDNGTYNTSSNNKFVSCGNNGSTDTNPMFSVIKYNENTNKSNNDYFSRTYELADGASLNNVPYIPEVEGSAFYSLNYENAIRFGQLTNVRLFRLPSLINQAFDIDYTMVSETYRVIRSGTLHIVVDAYGENVEISDDFHFTGDESYLDAIEFGIELVDADSDLTKETINVKVTSIMPVDDETEFKYTVTSKRTNVI